MLEKVSYKLTITQEGPEGDKNFVNIIEGESKESLLSNLARCYRDLNRSERAPNIKNAKHWLGNPCDSLKRVHHFIIKYDVFMDGSKITVYHWEFNGLEESF